MPPEHIYFSTSCPRATVNWVCLLAAAGETALTLAAGSGEHATMQLLLEHGADISRCRTAGAQAIHTAAASGSVHQHCMLLHALQSLCKARNKPQALTHCCCCRCYILVKEYRFSRKKTFALPKHLHCIDTPVMPELAAAQHTV